MVLCLWLVALSAPAADWPMWGGTPARNMVSGEKNLPTALAPGKYKEDTEELDPATQKNIKWIAKVGSQCYGNPTVAKGRVFVGTNNEVPRDPKYKGDMSVVMCFDESTGQLLWQQVVPKLGSGKVSDWEFLGICSSPHVEGDRVYVLSSRCEVLCLDVRGMANGNDGPFTNEVEYVGGIEQGPLDGDILWRFDMREELGVFPHNITSSSVLIVGDRIYVTTSNGQDWSHKYIPSPRAPTLVCLDKNTGKLLGEEVAGISFRLFHCTWSSPAFGVFGGKDTVVFGAGDGFTYGFDPVPVPDQHEEGFANLPERWRVDCVPHEQRFRPDGRPWKYPDPRGPSEIIATPVVYKGRIYVSLGQDPEHGEGVGALTCMDPTRDNKIVWQSTKIGRAISTVAIQDDLLYVADYGGRIYCLDALTGKEYWTHETHTHIWASPLVADGKVYLGGEDGSFWIFATGKEKKLLSTQTFEGQVYSSAVAANGVLYVATMTHLYALEVSKP
jgi:outer membrane protein assembly factor BamB